MARKQFYIFAAGLVCIALTMRAPITAVGPLAGYIQTAMGLSASSYGVLTTIPLLAFAVMSVLAGRIGGRFGCERMLFFGMAALLCGVLARSFAGNVGFFAGTIVIGVGISFSNVLLPVIIKERTPDKIGSLTGLYTACMGLTAGLAGAASVPLAELPGMGWRGSLAVWGVFVILALVLWLPQLRRGKREERLPSQGGSAMGGIGGEVETAGLTGIGAGSGADGREERKEPPRRKGAIYRRPLAWQITMAMGLQSLLFYSMVAFMPTMLVSRGFTYTQAGYLMLLTQLTSPLGNLLLPAVFQSPRRQPACIAGIGLLYSAGFFVLVLGGGAALTVLCTGLCGVGMGASLTAVMCLIGAKAADGAEAAALSGMSQAVGYLLAAAGPVLLGAVFDGTGTWTVPLLLLLCVNLAWIVFGLLAVRKR